MWIRILIAAIFTIVWVSGALWTQVDDIEKASRPTQVLYGIIVISCLLVAVVSVYAIIFTAWA